MLFAILLVLVTAECGFELTFLCIDNQQVFLQQHAAVFIPASSGKTVGLGHLPSQIHIESNSNVNVCTVLYLKAYLWHTEPFRKESNGSWMSFMFTDNNRQHMPACAKVIFLVKGKFYTLLRYSLGCCGICGFCSLCLPDFHPHAGDRARVSNLARQQFLKYITTRNWHQSLLQFAVLGLSKKAFCLKVSNIEF